MLGWSREEYDDGRASHGDHSSFAEERFHEAIHSGIERASKPLHGITGFHVPQEKAKVDKGQISEYHVTMEVTFVLDE